MEANQERNIHQTRGVLAKVGAYLEEMEAWRKEIKATREASPEKKEPAQEKVANVAAHPEDFNRATLE
jgi:hypothetical protein